MTGVEAADALGARGEYVVEFDGKGGSVVRDLVVRCRDCEHAFPSPWTDERVAGILRWSSWEKDDERRSKVEVIVEDVELASRPQGQQPAETQAQATTPAARAAAAVTVHEPTTEAMDLYGEEATW